MKMTLRTLPNNARDMPKFFHLKKNELGTDAVGLMNERFRDNRHIVIDTSENSPYDRAYEDAGPGWLNDYQRYALGPIIGELLGTKIQLLNPQLSELALKYDKNSVHDGFREPLGVAVFSLTGPKELLARHLVAQAKERGFETEFPLVFYGLKTIKDDRFPDGLRLDLDEVGGFAYSVPILSRTGEFEHQDPSLVKNGFPSVLYEGQDTRRRYLTTNPHGLQGLSRERYYTISAHGSDLKIINSNTRLTFIIEPTSPNLEARL